ncbi:MAG: hypothetical protein Q7T70_06200 [Polaromonas sp.]|nr:hypothetical protein [Polaromonas sp.]
MKKLQSELIVDCDLQAKLPLLPAELKLVQELLPELVKDVLWLQDDKE